MELINYLNIKIFIPYIKIKFSTLLRGKMAEGDIMETQLKIKTDITLKELKVPELHANPISHPRLSLFT